MTSQKRKQVFTAPVFKTAHGDRLLISFPGLASSYLSSRQIKCNWPEIERVGTNVLVSVGQKEFDLGIKHSVQNATSRVQTQHRYAINGFAPIFDALNGQPEDIFGLARSSTGKYSIEKNTDEVKAIHVHFFPPKSDDKSTSSGAPTPTATKKQKGHLKKNPISAATTTMAAEEDYPEYDEDADMYASEGNTRRKRVRIGGSSGPTRVHISGVASIAGGTTSKRNSNQIERLMGPLTRPPSVPMPLFPGEVPLGIETFFGEGNYARLAITANALSSLLLSPAVPNSSAAIPECTVKPPNRYRYAVNRAREGMKKKAAAKGGKSLVLRVLRAVELFERICLGDCVVENNGQRPITAADRRAACIEYDSVLREIYPELMLDAHVLDVKILEDMEGTDELQLLRCMERRFIIWKQNQGSALQPLQNNSRQQQQQRTANSKQEGVLSAIGSSFNCIMSKTPMTNATAGAGHQGAAPKSTRGGGGPAAHHPQQGTCLPKWGDGLKNIWKVFSSRLADKTYGGVDLRTTNANVSCALNDTIWWNGQLVRRSVPSNQPVLSTIADAIAGARDGNPCLYLTDGSMPDYEAQNYPRAAPGMPCLVDTLSNAMLPHAVRSSRSTNLFHFLKNESTGTGTFTLFGGVGPGANLTAFHFETKRRRSYNCATGDYIFQPLAACANTRAMMRVHAAVVGRHSRHGQLLPLECYLEEGIVLVTHLRIDPDPSLCELCEQSMHAFITFDDGANSSGGGGNSDQPTILNKNVGRGSALSKLIFPPPSSQGRHLPRSSNLPRSTENTTLVSSMPLKVSCNDFDLIWDIDATYCMERVSNAYKCMKILPEEAPPPDNADTWIQSSYLTAEPRTLKGLQGTAGGCAGVNKNMLLLAAAGTTISARPWACEVNSAARNGLNSPGWKPDPPGQKSEIGDFELDSGMDVIVVRTTEKLLDVVLQKVTADVAQPWVGEIPSLDEAKEALKRLIPILNHMHSRAFSENEESLFFLNPLTTPGIASLPESQTRQWIDKCHYSREYLGDLLGRISSASRQVFEASGSEAAGVDIEKTINTVISHVPPSLVDSEDSSQLATELPENVLRKLWMCRLISERNAVLEEPLNLGKVAEARRRRHAAELAFDISCIELIQRNSSAWGMRADKGNEVEVY